MNGYGLATVRGFRLPLPSEQASSLQARMAASLTVARETVHRGILSGQPAHLLGAGIQFLFLDSGRAYGPTVGQACPE